MIATSPRKIAHALLCAVEQSPHPGSTMTAFSKWLYSSGLWKERHRIIAAFAEQEMNRRGLHKTEVTTARPLSADERTVIRTAVCAVQKHINEEHLLFEWSIDESLLGGIKIAFDGIMIDATLQHRLSSLTTSIR